MDPSYESMGGAAGCRELALAFYGRVAHSTVLRPLFPGKSLRCATEELAAFLVEFFDGPGPDTQKRWWVSLRESHARFHIGPAERDEWLRLMFETLDEADFDQQTREALREFFARSSAYVMGDTEASKGFHLIVDDAIEAIRSGHDERAIRLAEEAGPARRVGLLAAMIGSRNPALLEYVCQRLDTVRQFAGRTLLHVAAGKGELRIVKALLKAGADADARSTGGHTPLYDAANQSGTADVVRALVSAGANVIGSGALHMAARRGNVEVAEALLEAGAEINARDGKGDTPLQRAINCRKPKVAVLLAARGGVA